MAIISLSFFSDRKRKHPSDRAHISKENTTTTLSLSPLFFQTITASPPFYSFPPFLISHLLHAKRLLSPGQSTKGMEDRRGGRGEIYCTYEVSSPQSAAPPFIPPFSSVAFSTIDKILGWGEERREEERKKTMSYIATSVAASIPEGFFPFFSSSFCFSCTNSILTASAQCTECFLSSPFFLGPLWDYGHKIAHPSRHSFVRHLRRT